MGNYTRRQFLDMTNDLCPLLQKMIGILQVCYQVRCSKWYPTGNYSGSEQAETMPLMLKFKRNVYDKWNEAGSMAGLQVFVDVPCWSVLWGTYKWRKMHEWD